MGWRNNKEGSVSNKVIAVMIAGIVLYAIVAWIVALKVIVDFLFMVGGWIVH